MKKLFLVLLLATTVAQAETYKWTDKQGTVHFSEYPGEVPADYRNSAQPLGIDTSKTMDKGMAVSSDYGSVAPKVEDLKEQMLKDEGVMSLIREMQNDTGMRALLSDPALINAIQAGDIGTLINNPDFLKLLNNPRVREIEKRMQQIGTR